MSGSAIDDLRRAERFVERALAARRRIAVAEAAEVALLAEAHAWVRSLDAQGTTSHGSDLAARDLAAQLGAATRIGDRTVQARMDAAASLSTLLPATLAAWQEGAIDRRHVSVIVDASAGLFDDDARAWFERRVLAQAKETTATRLRPIAVALAERAHPASLADRHARARVARRVIVANSADGMARLIADLPAVEAHGIVDRLGAMARAVRDAGGDAAADSRSLDELRADVLTDLLLGADPVAHGDGLAGITGHVQVTVPVMTAVAGSTEPCVLAGYGPVPLDDALRLAGAASGWDRVMTHPVEGTVLAVDRYRPSERLRRFLRARDEHCRFVGCRLPVWRSDIDHTVDAAHGGATRPDNLAHLCRRHHVLKHASAWSVVQTQAGVLRWTSPTGRTYTDRPAPAARFISHLDPPPDPDVAMPPPRRGPYFRPDPTPPPPF